MSVRSERIVDWRHVVGELVLVHQHIRDLDAERVWAPELPEVAGGEEELAGTEATLGPLDERYKEFLRCANGWHNFFQWVHLFGTQELLGEPMKLARRCLRDRDESGLLEQARLSAASLLPIAMTSKPEASDGTDLFLIGKPDTDFQGKVTWLSPGDEVDRFPSFDEFFLAMLDYNRAEVESLAAEKRDRLM